jgi:hypothetical protein
MIRLVVRAKLPSKSRGKLMFSIKLEIIKAPNSVDLTELGVNKRQKVL